MSTRPTEQQVPGPDGADEWDQLYGATDQVWSGEPDSTLVELAGRTPGRALDVGCGEGADAVWLAEQGWQVTALDVSSVALARAAAAAEQAGVEVRWLHAGLLDAGLAPGSFDLVSAQYAVLRRTADRVAERCLLSLVAPGGLLLVVHHAATSADHDAASTDHDGERGAEQSGQHGFDPADYVGPDELAELLDESWQVELHETRPRHLTSGAGAHHVADVVLRARRLG